MSAIQMLLGMGESLKVTASSVSGSSSGGTPAGSVSTTGDPPTPIVTGGSGSYTYSWSQVGTPATSGPYNITGPTTANPTWSDTVVSDDVSPTESWRLTVTDTGTSATATVDITVTLTWFDTT